MSEKATRLDWIPMGSSQLRPPAHLKQSQRGYWWNLFWAMFDAEPQGYLAVTSDLWLVAGSRDRQRWEAQGEMVTAAFDTAEIAGQHVIYFPPLIAVLRRQRKKLKKPKRASANDSLSLSLDFDLKEKEKKNLATDNRTSKKPQARSGNYAAVDRHAERVAGNRRAILHDLLS